MRGGRGGMGAPRFRGGGRGFMGHVSGNGGPGPSNHGGPSNHRGHPGPDHRHRPPMRFRNWQDELHGINEPEVFAETRLPDGRCYYYNTRTRETMWERPEGPGVRIIRHEEVGRGKGSGHGGPPVGMSFPQPRGGDFSAHNRDDGAPGTSPIAPFQSPPHGNSLQGPSPRSMLLPPPRMQGEHRFPQQGPTQQMHGHGPPGGGPRSDGLHSGPSLGMGPPPMGGPGVPPPGFMFNANPHMNPPHGPGGPHMNSNPNMQFPVPSPMAFWTPSGVPPPVIDAVMTQMDPAIVAFAAEWTEHVSPDGKTYFFSSKTQASVWEKPKALVDLEEAKAQAQLRALAAQQASTNSATGSSAQAEQDAGDKSKTRRVEKVEKCRPISSTPVPGTPWCVVWTGDRRVFFYNPANKTSVWVRPEELTGRTDVDEMIRVCPIPKIKRAEATSTTSPLPDASDVRRKITVTAAAVVPCAEPAPAPLALPTHDDTRPPGEDASPEPPQKRIRTSSNDGNISLVTLDDEDEVSGKPSPEVKELIETKDALREMSAIEAEAKASRERATIPMEIRLKQFREMLIESNVSAFSTWEKELHKIVFDQRYLLLTSNERKKAFDRYVEEIVEDEKLQKQSRHRETKEKFFEFLAEIKVSCNMNYNDFSQKYGRHERFRGVEKSRDRESFFMQYLKKLQRLEKEKRVLLKEMDRQEFLQLLREKVNDCHFSLYELEKTLEQDPRYHSLEPDERNKIFRSFQHGMRQERRAKEKQKKRERAAARQIEKMKKEEGKDSGEEKSPGEVENAADGTQDISVLVDLVSEEEEGCITDDSDDDVRYDRERQERAEHSIREREKQVQLSLATCFRERDKERKFHRHEEAVQEFQALLTDVIRTSDMTWRETKKLVKKDPRYELVSSLLREEMEDLFLNHVDVMARKKKQRFQELLDEHRVNPRTKWRDLYPKIRSDPRCAKFNTSERKCQREFDEYIRDMQAHQKVEFRELLKETKMLNYRTCESVKHNPNLLREIESHLENDRRYLELENLPGERERLLLDYLEDLESKGPPPPPTASEPIRRK